MKHYLSCCQCSPADKYKVAVEYTEDGYYYFECPQGHKNFVVLQEQKFETLFQIGANAIYDGYYREAVSSFTSSLERFYEFCVQIFCTKHQVDENTLQECCKFYSKSSERQFGSFLFLYLIEFNELPFKKMEDEKWRSFRNNVIHCGYIPTQDEALEYGNYVRLFILNTIIKLQENYSNELDKLTFENLKKKALNNKYNCNVTTLCYPNILSLANGDIKKAIDEDFVSEIKSMKRLEHGLATH